MQDKVQDSNGNYAGKKRAFGVERGLSRKGGGEKKKKLKSKWMAAKYLGPSYQSIRYGTAVST